eukprot:1188580-Prorocentrum_minimum.AAC.2
MLFVLRPGQHAAKGGTSQGMTVTVCVVQLRNGLTRVWGLRGTAGASMERPSMPMPSSLMDRPSMPMPSGAPPSAAPTPLLRNPPLRSTLLEYYYTSPRGRDIGDTGELDTG